jgi:ethanolamine ammonia-lyase large subunit
MMMEIEKSDAWQRHQLAAVERMQRDLARYTQPVIRVVGLCGVAYLVLGAPVFVLAVGVEQYFRGRLARISG